jgi:Pyridoxamine 5'-phosphate oxidase
MMQGFTVANFRHVADGLQEGQFGIGERTQAGGFSDLDPIYKQLMDRPVTMTLGLIGPDGRPSLTPMWFDYEDDKVLVNTASHRPKCAWIRKNPRLTVLLVNPENPYHWMQIRCTVERRCGNGRRAATTSPSSSTASGRSTPAIHRLTPCATRRLTRNGCCSSAASTASRPSASRRDHGVAGSFGACPESTLGLLLPSQLRATSTTGRIPAVRVIDVRFPAGLGGFTLRADMAARWSGRQYLTRFGHRARQRKAAVAYGPRVLPLT